MKKKRGFTLVELVISIALLSVIIMMSSTLYDSAIKVVPSLRDITNKNEKSVSIIENESQKAKIFSDVYREYKNGTGLTDSILEKLGLKDTYVYPRELKFISDVTGSNSLKIGDKIIQNIKGYYISASNGKFDGFNKVSSESSIFAIKGLGSLPPKVTNINGFYINNPASKYIFLEEITGKKSYDVKYSVGLDGKKEDDVFYRLASRQLISPVSDESIIYTPYIDVMPNSGISSLTEDMFEMQDSFKSEGRDGKITYSVPPKEKEELDIIDRTFAATAVTQNTNGFEGSTVKTFSDEKGRSYVHFVGLPYPKDLLAYYDANLALSKSRYDNKYYSVFDDRSDSKEAMIYSDLMLDLSGDRYLFGWKDSIDTRKMTGLSDESPQGITMPKGFLKKRDVLITSKDRQEKIPVPNASKPYGNSIYYDMSGGNNIKLNADKNGEYFIIKFNTKNYNREYNGKSADQSSFPFVILSHNLNLENGEPIKKEYIGLAIYADKDGNLREYTVKQEWTGRGYEMKSNNKDLNYNIYSKSPYKNNTEYKFDTLEKMGKEIKDRRDGREDYIIMGIYISKDSTKALAEMYFLESVDGNTIRTTTKDFEHRNHTYNNLDPDNSEFIFGGEISNAVNGAIDAYSGVQPVMEISDVLYYYNFDRFKTKHTMNYLYRKFLTENERGDGGKYDQFYLNNY